MIFNSFEFGGFFASVFVLYWLCSRSVRIQNTLLLAASYFFYGSWDYRFLSLIVVSTLIDFGCGAAMGRRDNDGEFRLNPRRRKLLLCVSLVANLGMLGFFKYYDFFLTGFHAMLAGFGIDGEPRLLNIILPVGISFYTFQTLSYTIDVYRGRLAPTRNLLDFAVFVAFFPQLVAGPIVRAIDFLPQIAAPRRFRLQQFYTGSYLIFWGLFKKIVIADNLAWRFVDPVFSNMDDGYSGAAVLVATYAFAFQIYCDFSGYSDIARGCARTMGLDICLNFNLPYLASNPSEFWRRWHISLSNWLRDYLYIPLGGSRKGKRRTQINLLATMVLGGLWHGAAWTFVIWGAFQGVLLMAYRALGPAIQKLPTPRRAWMKRLMRIASVIVFFHFVCLGWLIFRAESVGQLWQMLGALFTPWLWWIIAGPDTFWMTGIGGMLIVILPLLIMQAIQHVKQHLEPVATMSPLKRSVVYASLFYGLVLFGADVDKPFIYFQF